MRTRHEFALDLLRYLELPETLMSLVAVLGWITAENSRAAWNPLATTRTLPGMGADFNGAGVRNYQSYEAGLIATTYTLRQDNMKPIRDAFEAQGSTKAILGAIKASPWAGAAGYPFDPATLEAQVRSDWAIVAVAALPGS